MSQTADKPDMAIIQITARLQFEQFKILIKQDDQQTGFCIFTPSTRLTLRAY